MSIYKVYAQGVKVRKSVIVLQENELNQEVANLASDYLANVTFLENEDEEKRIKAYDAIVEILYEAWRKNKELCFGDYIIKETEEEPGRPFNTSVNLLKDDEIMKKMESEDEE